MMKMVGTSAVQATVLTLALVVGGFAIGVYGKGKMIEGTAAAVELRLKKQAEDFQRKLQLKDDVQAEKDAQLMAQFDRELNALRRKPSGFNGTCLSPADVKRLRSLFAHRPR